LRQLPTRYAFHAGQNLPDKEFRYLRTIIVIADVHWRFGDWREPLPLTFQHWSGVSPYTSPYGFAETCVFGKQSVGILSLRPTCFQAGKAYCELTPSFFAEFLNERSPVDLRLLALSTCVGLRYGYNNTSLRSFSWHSALLSSFGLLLTSSCSIGIMLRGFASVAPSEPKPQSNKGQRVQECVTPSNIIVVQEY
jgi:hypothetical protein